MYLNRLSSFGISFLVYVLLLAPASLFSQTISGHIFRDFDADGTRDSLESPVAGVVVTAYDAGLVVLDATATDNTGGFVLNVPAATEVRLEVTGLPSFLRPGPAGNDSLTTVSFVRSPVAGLGIGLANPAEYCQANPDMVTNCYLQGDQSTQSGDVLVSFPFSAGLPGNSAIDDPTRVTKATAQQIGTTWGLAYQRESGSIFAAAFMKRHAGFGPGGSGAIYRISGGSASVFMDLDALFGSGTTGTNPHPSGTDFEVDPNAWDPVGKMSLGDLDISDDGTTLWTINLTDRQLYEIPIGVPPNVPSVSDINLHPLPMPADCPDATVNIRPFATAYQDGLVYAGMVCSAETTQNAADLRAYVYVMSSGIFTQILNFRLDYPRRCAVVPGCANTGINNASWNPWVDMFTVLSTGFGGEFIYPQPWLTDIDFDQGDILIGLRDRFADQTGVDQRSTDPLDMAEYSGDGAGDILRACQNGTGWVLESDGICGSRTTAGPGNDLQGPGSPGGEFYYGDNFSQHDEISMAGLAQVPGFADIALTAYDVSRSFEGGIMWLSNNDGSRTRSYQIYQSNSGPTFGKAGGLGDLEALCDPAPIEIGNRIWEDLDGDGIQDPGEPGIAGVSVVLTCGGPDGVLGTGDDVFAGTTTNSDGEYLFDSTDGLTPNTQCTLSISLAGLGGLGPTVLDYNSNLGETDLHDSDGMAGVIPGSVVASFTTGAAGNNDHSFDFGFTAPGSDCLALTGEVLCATDGSGDFHWSFRIRNLSGVPVYHMFLIDNLTDVTFEPNFFDFSDEPQGFLSSNPNRPSLPKWVKIKGAMPGQTITFPISIHDQQIDECCSTEVILELPACDCAQLPQAQDFLQCDPFNPGKYTYTFGLDNLFDLPIEYILLAPDPPGSSTIDQDTGRLWNAPVFPGGSTQKTITIHGQPDSEACFRVSSHDGNLEECCSIRQCVNLQRCVFTSHPIGGGEFIEDPTGLQIFSIGSGGDDGVAIYVEEAGAVELGWSPLEPGEAASLTIGGAGSIGGNNGRELGTTRIDDLGAELEIGVDLSVVGSDSHRLEVYDDGVLVAAADGRQGPVARVSEWPAGGGENALWHDGEGRPTFGFFWSWDEDVAIEIPDAFTSWGDQLRVLAEGAAAPVELFSEIRILAANIPIIEVVEASITAADAPPVNAAGCVPSSDRLCLNDHRFLVEVDWRDGRGNTGRGQAMHLAGNTGYFWFFDEANVELVVKVLDGRDVNGHWWVFYGALSDVEYTLTVTDTGTGESRTYFNPLGQLASVGDVEAIPGASILSPDGHDSVSLGGFMGGNHSVSLGGFKGGNDSASPKLADSSGARTPVKAAGNTCIPEPETLCLNDQRFEVRVTWKDGTGNEGTGHATPLTGDTGYFWFFDDANVELMIKILDGRALNGSWWVFYGSLSNMEFSIVVTDTQTGQSKTYFNPFGRFASVGDTGAF